MGGFEDDLKRRLEQVEAQNLRRILRRLESGQKEVVETDGKRLINFSSNDYLGLANHPKVQEGAMEALHRFGTGSGASRLISGSIAIHHELEAALAEWKQVESALIFSSGYAAATGTIPALVGKDDLVVLDKLVHASIVDGARLSGAKLRVFHHNDLSDLESILKWARISLPKARVLVVTESVFSMDGDLAPLKELAELKDCHGAWLMVDEAHACGIFGSRLSGRIEAEGVQGRVEVQMGTMGKALGASGGFIAGSKVLIDYLVNKARTFVFSTAPLPAASGAALAAVRLVQKSEGRELSKKLAANVDVTRSELTGVNCLSPIVPIIVGDETSALLAAENLKEAGFWVPAIRYPTVARGQARLRVSLSAGHSVEQVRALAKAFRSLPAIKGFSSP